MLYGGIVASISLILLLFFHFYSNLFYCMHLYEIYDILFDWLSLPAYMKMTA